MPPTCSGKTKTLTYDIIMELSKHCYVLKYENDMSEVLGEEDDVQEKLIS